MISLTIRIPENTHQALREEAFKQRTSIAKLIVRALNDEGYPV